MVTSLLVALTLFTLSYCAPQIAFPINSQVPPVARVGSPFSFTFSKSTFTSSVAQLQYELQNAPKWLVLDGAQRTFTGTPDAQSTGPVQFGLKASDPSGSTFMNITFFISQDQAPQQNSLLLTPSESTAIRSGPANFVSYPSRPFSIKFGSNAFSDSGKNIQYYATSADNTPLPSWIAFDAGSLTFSGVAPSWSSLVSPPQTFGLRIIASYIPGFAGTSTNLSITVGTHALSFDIASKTITTNRGSSFSYADARQGLKLDGQPIRDSDIAQADLQGPSWVKFDRSSFVISGSFPSDASPTNVTLKVTDNFGDIASCTINIAPQSPVFNGTLNDVDAVAGQSVNYQISQSLNLDVATVVSAVIDPPVSWIHFDSASLRVLGDIPSDVSASELRVNITASQKGSRLGDSQLFRIHVQVRDVKTSSTLPMSTTPLSKATSTVSKGLNVASSSTTVQPVQASGVPNKRTTLIAILVPLSVLAMVLAGILVCYRQHRSSQRSYSSPAMKPISKPFQGTPLSRSEMSCRSPLGKPVLNMGMGNSSRSLHRRRFANDLEASDDEMLQSRSLHEPALLEGAPTQSPGTVNFSKRTPHVPPRPLRADEPQSQQATLRLVSTETLSLSSTNRPLSGVGHGSGHLSTLAPSSFASFDYPRTRRRDMSQAFTTSSWQTEDTGELEIQTINRPSVIAARAKGSVSTIRSPPAIRRSSTRALRSSIINNMPLTSFGRGESPFFHSSRGSTQQASSRNLQTGSDRTSPAIDPRISDVLNSWNAITALSSSAPRNDSSNLASAGSGAPSLSQLESGQNDTPVRHVQRRSALTAIIEAVAPQSLRNIARSSRSTIVSQFRDASVSDPPSPANLSPRRRQQQPQPLDGEKRYTFGSGSPRSVNVSTFKLHRASGSDKTHSTAASSGTGGDDGYLGYYAGDKAVVETAMTGRALTPQLTVSGRASANTAISGESGEAKGLWGGGGSVRDVRRVSVRTGVVKEGRLQVSPSLSAEKGAFI